MSTQSEGSADVKQRPPQPETVTALLPRLHVENASAMRPVDALRSWLCDNIPEYGATSQLRRLRNTPRPAVRTDHQGEAARLSRVCRGLGLTFDAPRLRQAANPKMAVS